MFITILGGDFLIQAVDHQSLDKDDPLHTHHTILLRDLPTGKTAEVHCETEMDQVYKIAAWLLSDEDANTVSKRLMDALWELRAKTKGFLP